MENNKRFLVRGHFLYLPSGEQIDVDSPEWFEWVELNKSFRYEEDVLTEFSAPNGQVYHRTQTASFSACREWRPSGEFWYASRRINGKLRRKFLGRDEKLTYDFMLGVAQKLHHHPCKPIPTEKAYLGND